MNFRRISFPEISLEPQDIQISASQTTAPCRCLFFSNHVFKIQKTLVFQSMTNKAMTGIVNNITLIIYGTAEEPKHYEKGRHYKVKDETKSKSQQVDPNVSCSSFQQKSLFLKSK